MQTEHALLVDVKTLGSWASFMFLFKEVSRQLVYGSSSSRSEVWGSSALIKRKNSIPGLPMGASGRQALWDGHEL